MKTTAVEEKLEEVHADALAVFIFEGEKPTGEVEKLDRAVSGSVNETIKLGDFKGKLYEVTSIYTHGKVPSDRIFLTGAGKKGEFDARIARNVAGAATRRAIKLGVKKLAIYLSHEVNTEEVIEGAGLANYNPALYKTKKEENGEVEELILVGKVDKQTIKYSSVLLESTNWVRKLISEPANVLTPAAMVEEAKKLAEKYKFAIEVFDERQAEKKGMGAFVGVAKGSEEPSFLVSLKYLNSKAKSSLGIVGKGITFDSGGISIKPSKGMWEMKMDMAGAAASLGVMKWVGEVRPKLNITTVLPLTENLPSGKALKPGDVVKSLNGKTIEVTNTDAEGRVVLADALVYAQKLGATYLVDLATLTGAINVALGNVSTGVMGRPDSWVEKIIKLGREAGELFWQLPTFGDYKELLKSDIADLNNSPGEGQPSAVVGAGAIAGAMFLLEFVSEKVPFAHLDIASTAWLSGDRPYMTKGPTGVGVRTLVKLVESLEKGG